MTRGIRLSVTHTRSLTAAKGFTSHWLRIISASIANSIGTSITKWADFKARELLDDIGDPVAC